MKADVLLWTKNRNRGIVPVIDDVDEAFTECFRRPMPARAICITFEMLATSALQYGTIETGTCFSKMLSASLLVELKKRQINEKGLSENELINQLTRTFAGSRIISLPSIFKKRRQLNDFISVIDAPISEVRGGIRMLDMQRPIPQMTQRENNDPTSEGMLATSIHYRVTI